MRTKTIISPTTGRRTDRTDYPITAVREAIINALVHRDYSIHTEGMPIQLIMFEDRIEIHNPGGLYGRITIDQLGKIQPDTRNPVLASALETLGMQDKIYTKDHICDLTEYTHYAAFSIHFFLVLSINPYIGQV